MKQHNLIGSAILSALFIVTLVAILTTSLALQFKNQIEVTKLIFDTQNLQQTRQMMRYFAMDVLNKPGQIPHHQKNKNFSIKLIDLNAKLNINSLKNGRGKTTFYRLAKHILEDSANKKTYPITSKITAYVKAHPLVSLSELDLIKGIAPDDIKKLKPFLTALPLDAKININTAPVELLMAMSTSNHPLEAMEKLMKVRGQTGIQSVDDVTDILKKLSIKPGDVATESEYFLSIGQLQNNKKTLALYSLLHRVKNIDETYTVYLVHETVGTD